jgi:hypothetical protein
MPKTKSKDKKNDGDLTEPLLERTGVRSSPGSGENEDEAADLQPDDVEKGGPAR